MRGIDRLDSAKWRVSEEEDMRICSFFIQKTGDPIFYDIGGVFIT